MQQNKGSGVVTYFKHLSPSTVNSFIDYRSRWFVEKVLKRESSGNPDMIRGGAVERGISHYLISNQSAERGLGMPVSLTEASKEALRYYNEEVAKLTNPDKEKVESVRSNIPDLVGVGVLTLKPYGKLESYQRKIFQPLEDATPLKWMGFTDFIFEGGKVVDLKVTGRAPSELSGAHARQGAFYQHTVGNEKGVDFLYLIATKEIKTKTITLENHTYHLDVLKKAANIMDRVLSYSDDPMELAPIFFPALDDWSLNDETLRSHVREIWSV